MLELLGTAILRKVIFMGLLYLGYRLIDAYYFKAFDTDEVIKNDPTAISIILGLFALALAFA